MEGLGIPGGSGFVVLPVVQNLPDPQIPAVPCSNPSCWMFRLPLTGPMEPAGPRNTRSALAVAELSPKRTKTISEKRRPFLSNMNLRTGLIRDSHSKHYARSCPLRLTETSNNG